MENIEQNIVLVEQEPIEEEKEIEPRDFSGEASSLRSEMRAKISEAVSLGVFTNKEASEWESGFDACTELEHMYNLIEIIDDFISSGLEVVEEISDTLNTDLLTNREKATWEMMADRLSYQEKHRLLSELSSILKNVAKNKQTLFKLMQSNKLSLTKAKELINTFVDVDADDKAKVVDKAKLEISNEANRRRLIKSQVTALLAQKKHAEARSYLSNNTGFLEDADHASIIEAIDRAEITHTLALLHTA